MIFLQQSTSFDPIITTQGSPILVFQILGWVFTAIAFIIFIAALITAILDKDNELISVVITFGLIFGLLFWFTLTVLNSPSNKETNNVDGAKTWLQDTYVLEVNTNEVNDLINGREDYDTPTTSRLFYPSTATYYGETILINLVKYDKEWRVFYNGKELPRVDVTE